jgi:hypothetical protein
VSVAACTKGIEELFLHGKLVGTKHFRMLEFDIHANVALQFLGEGLGVLEKLLQSDDMIQAIVDMVPTHTQTQREGEREKRRERKEKSLREREKERAIE